MTRALIRPEQFQETDRKFQESERQMKQSNQETWAMFQKSKIENDKMMKDLSDNLKKIENSFESPWSRFLERLGEGDLIKLLEARGIEVKRTLERIKRYPIEQGFEFDILAVNDDEVVVVEIKDNLKNKDVRDFVAKLKHGENNLSSRIQRQKNIRSRRLLACQWSE